MKSELRDYAVKLITETPKAWLVHDGKKDFWIPKSVGELELNRDGKTYTLTVPAYWAVNKGLE